MLPILQLNGYKIANPTILARISREELTDLMMGYGYKPYFVEVSDPLAVHQLLASTMDQVVSDIRTIQYEARENGNTERPMWPMIVRPTPKGWTGPKEVDGLKTEDFWRSHQVPIADVTKPGHLALLEEWMKSYKPEELFDESGNFRSDLADLAPRGTRRMGANPHANGGIFLKDLRMPDFRDYALPVPAPGQTDGEATRVTGNFLRDIMKANDDIFRVVGPDETASNRLDALFEVTDRVWEAEILPYDVHLARDGRVMEILSEHTCQGWL